MCVVIQGVHCTCEPNRWLMYIYSAEWQCDCGHLVQTNLQNEEKRAIRRARCGYPELACPGFSRLHVSWETGEHGIRLKGLKKCRLLFWCNLGTGGGKVACLRNSFFRFLSGRCCHVYINRVRRMLAGCSGDSLRNCKRRNPVSHRIHCGARQTNVTMKPLFFATEIGKLDFAKLLWW